MRLDEQHISAVFTSPELIMVMFTGSISSEPLKVIAKHASGKLMKFISAKGFTKGGKIKISSSGTSASRSYCWL